jgi:hypothetical protein
MTQKTTLRYFEAAHPVRPVTLPNNANFQDRKQAPPFILWASWGAPLKLIGESPVRMSALEKDCERPKRVAKRLFENRPTPDPQASTNVDDRTAGSCQRPVICRRLNEGVALYP